MEEKSLEELMSDLSSTTTTESTSEGMLVIDMKDQPISEPVQIVSQSPIPGSEKMTLGGWATKQNIRLLDTKYYNDTNFYSLDEYYKMVPRDIEVPLYTEEVKSEVQEMVEAETFMSKNIDKDMPTLEREFVQMERKAAVIDKKIDAIKTKYADVFKEIAELEVEKDKILAPKEDYREVIARKLFLIGEKKWKGMEVEFTYVGPSFKDKFNQTKFKEEQPIMYAKYVEKNPVKEYIKTKLSLLPVILDEEEK